MSEPLERMVGQRVVLDTATPIVYVGTLTEVTDHTFVLANADMHDCRDGHASKEDYVAQAAQLFDDHGAANRREVVVLQTAVISVSRISDIIA